MRKTLQELGYRVDATMPTTILTQQFLTEMNEIRNGA